MSIIPVPHRHNKLIIVGSGSSLNEFDKHQLETLNVPTIAVNREYWKFNATYFCTIDPLKQVKTLCDTSKNTYKYVGFPEVLTGHNVHLLKRYYQPRNFLLCTHKDTLQSHNSSYAALNLAYHMEAKKILLLGVDADTYRYPKESKGWRISISKMPRLFSAALPQLEQRKIKVINGSLQSNIMCFPKLSIDDSINWIMD